MPPYTFMATASAVLQTGAVPVFADVERSTLNLDPDRFAAAITPRTRAVIPVHFGGHAADMERILDISRRNGLVVIEDAAHAHGGEHNGQRLGTLSEWGSFSFQQSKVMTSGEGGCLYHYVTTIGISRHVPIAIRAASAVELGTTTTHSELIFA